MKLRFTTQTLLLATACAAIVAGGYATTFRALADPRHTGSCPAWWIVLGITAPLFLPLLWLTIAYSHRIRLTVKMVVAFAISEGLALSVMFLAIKTMR